MDSPIASAVVIPEPEPEPEFSPPRAASPPISHKRRQSSISSDSAKRPRLTNDRPASPKHAKAPAPVRRERGRERRLFGAVLGALSQNPSTAAQKRRSEIEKRQLAQRRLDDDETEQRRAERAAKRKAQRWSEHRRFEREAMRVRHENLIDTAHFLWTETQPRLYYKPWETTPEEEDRIQDQVDHAHETVRRETEEYEARLEEDARRERQAEADRNGDTSQAANRDNVGDFRQPATTNGATNSTRAPTKDEDMKDSHAQPPTNDVLMEEHALADVQDSNISSHDALRQDHIDEIGEEIVEATEDTVIY